MWFAEDKVGRVQVVRMNNASNRKTERSTMACLSPKHHEVLLTIKMLEQNRFSGGP